MEFLGASLMFEWEWTFNAFRSFGSCFIFYFDYLDWKQIILRRHTFWIFWYLNLNSVQRVQSTERIYQNGSTTTKFQKHTQSKLEENRQRRTKNRNRITISTEMNRIKYERNAKEYGYKMENCVAHSSS